MSFQRRTPLHLRRPYPPCCAWRPPPFSRGRMKGGAFPPRHRARVSANAATFEVRRRSARRKRRGGACLCRSATPASPELNKKEKGYGTPTDAYPTVCIVGCSARCSQRARLSAFHRGSRQGELSSPRLSVRPCFLGRGGARDPEKSPVRGKIERSLCGCYPPQPVPAQGSISHPGHSAGRHDARAARERFAIPPAGTALAPVLRYASAAGPLT